MMAKFKIEVRDGEEYITNLAHDFTLLVIPPEKQPEGYELGRQVVGVDFVSFADKVILGMNEPGYDFESLDDAYFDDDTEHCNKEIWYETIEYYCSLVLDKEPAGYTAYNYDYDLTEDNCSSECWHSLNEAFPAEPELAFGNAKAKHLDCNKTLQLKNITLQIKPAFETRELAKEEGVYTYRLLDFMMDLTYLPEWSRPKGYVSPDEMKDSDNPYFYGRLFFDTEDNWIYDGNQLNIAEQEQVAAFILAQ